MAIPGENWILQRIASLVGRGARPSDGKGKSFRMTRFSLALITRACRRKELNRGQLEIRGRQSPRIGTRRRNKAACVVLILLLLTALIAPHALVATEAELQAEGPLVNSDDYTAAGQVSSRTLVEKYPSERTTWFIGPSVVHSASVGSENFLRAYQPAGGEIVYQLYVILKSPESWFWVHRASDGSGNRFTIEERSVDKDSELTTEHLLINLNGRYLTRVAAKRGLSLRVSGYHRAIVVELPAFYVQGFLQKISSWTKRTDLGVSP